ncbi:tRNA (adenosine(37)-N6)-threonylcarbamoyltransferase complex ATPase subunit type 1 TsaE [Proteocatella sphenisci]|uniref:tRNA (adenosine(37)-N6)-threonylcarbamoyltransferase complex ATPase subunit type 1 TsaE n=1 Tax=Proteocatella sphenisci TaxID=181070 RepID=UPI0004AF828F|nr:tRNA (adenosine(37)-N6)-threonylcarbamoyltransferase complex ATPase subunit type 1 TsaE [Proteocatella sphenisci]
MKKYIENVEKTIEIGMIIGRALKNGDIICLDGDLGAGKTHLSKGIAKGLDIEEEITSPTFTIVQEYEGRIPLYHFDVYRIADSEEMYNVGFEDYLNKNGAIIIEWSEIIRDILPNDRLEIKLVYAPEGGRYFTFNAFGKRHEDLLRDISERLT